MVTLIFPPLKQKRCTRSSGSHRSCHQRTRRFTLQSRKMRKPVNFRIGQYLGERPINPVTWDLICLWVNTYKESSPFKKYSWTVDRHPSLGHHQNPLNWIAENVLGDFRNQKGKRIGVFLLRTFFQLFRFSYSGFDCTEVERNEMIFLGKEDNCLKAVHYPP